MNKILLTILITIVAFLVSCQDVSKTDSIDTIDTVSTDTIIDTTTKIDTTTFEWFDDIMNPNILIGIHFISFWIF